MTRGLPFSLGSPGGTGYGAVLSGLLLLGISACSVFPTEAPPVADSVMVDVLVELRMADSRAFVELRPTPGLRDSILARYEVSPEAYEAAAQYYVDHPETYSEVLSQVRDVLLEARTDYRSGEFEPDRPGLLADSLRADTTE